MLTVGRLARRFGLSRATLLYYDTLGLLSPSGRSSGDYRLYSESDVHRLARICRYRQAGVSLKDIKGLFDAPESTAAQVLERRLVELDDEIRGLREQQRIIVELLRKGGMHAAGDAPMDKDFWTSLLEGCGFTDKDMHCWHAEFERRAPERHRRFLEYLGIPAEDISLIRDWATNGRLDDRQSAPSLENDGPVS